MKQFSKFAIVKRPIVTEKSIATANSQNAYTFEVTKEATKGEIRHAVEELFSVTVGSVRIVNMKPKPRRVRYRNGSTRAWKKAIVKLSAGKIHLI